MTGAMLFEVRQALRVLRTQPLYTTIALLTLALGIGASTAIFSVLDAVVLRPLPYPEADRLVLLWGRDRQNGEGRWTSSYPDFVDLREQQTSFDVLAAWGSWQPRLAADGGEPMRLDVTAVSWDLLPALGVEPALGRGFRPEEDVADGPRVALLSQSLWRDRFGADPAVLGRPIDIDGTDHTVVGVMPADFRGGSASSRTLPPSDTEAWVPLRRWSTERGVHNLVVVGKLRDGVGLRQAGDEVASIAARLEAQYPGSNADRGAWLEPAHDALLRNARPVLKMILGAVGLVLLISCANVAGLLAGRADARRKEVAIRAALGAGRSRLVVGLLVESTLLGLAGGALGVVVARWGMSGFLTLVPAELPRIDTVEVDARVLGFALAVSLGTGLLFGLLPALAAARSDLGLVLKERGAGGDGRGSARLRRLLVVAEVALAMVLTIGAALLGRSFLEVLRVEPGFDPTDVLAVDLQTESVFVGPDWPRDVRFFSELLERVEGLPGVEAAVAAYNHPLSRGWETGFTIAGRQALAEGQEPEANLRPVTPGYFEAMRVPLLRGRTFTPADDAEAPPVVIVNDSFVRRYFPDEDPVGQRLVRGHWWTGERREWEIVGVVADVKFGGLDDAAERTGAEAYSRWAMYYTHAQQPMNFMTLLVRTESDPLRLAAAVRREVWALEPDMPVERVTTLASILAESVAPRRFNMLLIGGFAAVALSLAAVGIYGVLATAVVRRRREIGIRLALGARGVDVRRLVVGEGMRLALLGGIIGCAGALALARLMEGYLFGVTPADPRTFVAVAALLLGVAALACWLPARRAASVDPLVSLGAE